MCLETQKGPPVATHSARGITNRSTNPHKKLIQAPLPDSQQNIHVALVILYNVLRRGIDNQDDERMVTK